MKEKLHSFFMNFLGFKANFLYMYFVSFGSVFIRLLGQITRVKNCALPLNQNSRLAHKIYHMYIYFKYIEIC